MDQSPGARRKTSSGTTRAPRAATPKAKRIAPRTAKPDAAAIPPPPMPDAMRSIPKLPAGTGADDPLKRMFAEIGEDLGILTGAPLELKALQGSVPEQALAAEVLEFARPIARLVAPPHGDADRLEAAAQVLGTLAEREASLASLAA